MQINIGSPEGRVIPERPLALCCEVSQLKVVDLPSLRFGISDMPVQTCVS